MATPSGGRKGPRKSRQRPKREAASTGCNAVVASPGGNAVVASPGGNAAAAPSGGNAAVTPSGSNAAVAMSGGRTANAETTNPGSTAAEPPGNSAASGSAPKDKSGRKRKRSRPYPAYVYRIFGGNTVKDADKYVLVDPVRQDLLHYMCEDGMSRACSWDVGNDSQVACMTLHYIHNQCSHDAIVCFMRIYERAKREYPNNAIQEAEDSLKAHDPKTLEFAKFREYVRACGKVEGLLSTFYTDCWREAYTEAYNAKMQFHT